MQLVGLHMHSSDTSHQLQRFCSRSPCCLALLEPRSSGPHAPVTREGDLALGGCAGTWCPC